MKIKITSFEEKLSAKNTPYWTVIAQNGDKQVKGLCFDGKMKDMKVNDEVEVDLVEKNDKDGKPVIYINFPKAKGEYSGKKGYAKSPQDITLQQNSFAMSYSKDLVVAMIAKDNALELLAKDGIEKTLLKLYHSIREELGKGIPKADAKPEVKLIDSFTSQDEHSQVNTLKVLAAAKKYTPKQPVESLSLEDRIKFFNYLNTL